ncbi:uncharacterized protein [Apostichopus japonicus]
MTFTGSTSVTFTFTITEDGIAEDTESFHIIIDSVQDNSGGQSLSIGTPKFAVLEVRDNDGEVSFVDATYFASAASTSVDIFVQASYPVNAATTVTLQVVDLMLGSCTLPTGLTDGNPVVCTISMGSQYATCTVSYSSDGCFGLDLMSAVGAPGTQEISTTSASTTVTIPPAAGSEISFAQSSIFVNEGVGTVDVVVVLSTATIAETNVAITLEAVAAGETAATEFDDFTTDTFAVVPNGGMMGTATVTIIDDSIFECLESIVLSLTAPGGETILEPMTTTIHIIDDDTAVNIDVMTSMNAMTVNENVGCFTIGLEASAVSECPYMGSYSVCGGTATPNQDIYTSGIYQLPTASTSQQIKFCLNDDSFQEGPETAYIAITAPSPYGSTLQRLAEITIADNEATGGDLVGISFTGGLATGTVDETGTTTAEIEVAVLTSFVGSVTLAYGPGDLTATADFTISTLTLLFDGIITTATATVTAVDDAVAEAEFETIEIYVLTSDNPVDELSSTVTLSVTDNDIELNLFPSTVLAGEGGVVYFVLALDKPSLAAYSNVISAVDLSTSTADYSAITSVDIAIGDRFVDFQFVLVDGDTTEITEFVEIVASAGGVSTTATVTVYDESNFGSKDALLLASQYAVLEGASSFTMNFITVGNIAGSIAFDLGTSSALSEGTDFILNPSAPGSATVPGVGIAVSIINDDVVEQASTEQFMVSFTSDDVFPQMSADVTIFDDDSQVTVDCNTAIVYSCEEDGVAFVEFAYQITASGGLMIDLGVLYADGTAEQTIDFDVIESSIVIEEITSSGVVTATVSIISDLEQEPDEEFYVYVEHNSYQTSTTATCTVIILDDDELASTTVVASTTAPVSTTFLGSTTDTATTTDRPTTTDLVTTTNPPTTTTDLGTTTHIGSTTKQQTTTDRGTTTDQVTTTGNPSTTPEITTTHIASTTIELTTTNRPTTTESVTTTEQPTTTMQTSTTMQPTTTDTPSTTGGVTTTNEPTTTVPQSTTDQISTTVLGTTTEAVTTTQLSTTEPGTTSVLPTTTDTLSTTVETTTESLTTTNMPSTTNPQSTSEHITTTDAPSTTGLPSTTKPDTTTELPSTTVHRTTTEQPSTTPLHTSTQVPSTTDVSSTTNPGTTTELDTTTTEASTTERQTTSVLPSTTSVLSTTNPLTTTDMPSTTTDHSTTNIQTTTEHSTSSLMPSTTRIPSTSHETTTDSISTTDVSSTTNPGTTTELDTTTTEASTTERQTTSVLPSTTSVLSTTNPLTTTDMPSTTTDHSTTNIQTTTEHLTSSLMPSTTRIPSTSHETTTDSISTTDASSTTNPGTTTELDTTTTEASTTERQTTSVLPSTTSVLSTTNPLTTTDMPSTTTDHSTTNIQTTTEHSTSSLMPSTTRIPSTTHETTTDSISTTDASSTTNPGTTTELDTTTTEASTTERQTTSVLPSTTSVLSTTNPLTTTEMPSTTTDHSTTNIQTTTEHSTSSLMPSTTRIPSTTHETTTDSISTTDKASTTVSQGTSVPLTSTFDPSTTLLPTTTVRGTTTESLTTTAATSTTVIETTSESLSTTAVLSSTDPQTTTAMPSSTGILSTTATIFTTTPNPTSTQFTTTAGVSTTDSLSTTMQPTTTDTPSTTVSTTNKPTTTVPQSTTDQISTTVPGTTTEAVTTTQLSTTEPGTTSVLPTTTDTLSTTVETTTESLTTTNMPSTTNPQSTSEQITTTDAPSTTGLPSTTKPDTTTELPSTTVQGTTTEQPSTTPLHTSTQVPSTTDVSSTTNPETTTELDTTTAEASTTERQTTSVLPSTTGVLSTTNPLTTTDMPSTTTDHSTTNIQTTTEHPTSSLMPSTTRIPSTTHETTTDSISTTDASSTTNPGTTTELDTTTTEASTTERQTTSVLPSTTGVLSTTNPLTTTDMPSTTTDHSTTNIQTTTEHSTSSLMPSTTRIPSTTHETTTDSISTTDASSTTNPGTTTELDTTTTEASTTERQTTSVLPSTTGVLSTTSPLTTTDMPSTTTDHSTTNIQTTTEHSTSSLMPSTTRIPSTTHETTTDSISTTDKASTTVSQGTSVPPTSTFDPSTTLLPTTTVRGTTTESLTTTTEASTTERQTTSVLPSTTGVLSTTNPLTTTDMPSTTTDHSTTNIQTTTEHSTSSLMPSTTRIPSTTHETTTDSISTTDKASTTVSQGTSVPPTSTFDPSTTLLPTTTVRGTTTESFTTTPNPTSTQFTTTAGVSTTDLLTTSEAPSTTAHSSTTEGDTSTMLSSTEVLSTTAATTTEVTTTMEVSSTMFSTTDSPTSSVAPSSSAAAETTTFIPSTTQVASTTDRTTTESVTTTMEVSSTMFTTTDSPTSTVVTSRPIEISTSFSSTEAGSTSKVFPSNFASSTTDVSSTDVHTSTFVSSTLISTTPVRSTTVITPVTEFTTSDAPGTTSGAPTTNVVSTGTAPTTGIEASTGISEASAISTVTGRPSSTQSVSPSASASATGMAATSTLPAGSTPQATVTTMMATTPGGEATTVRGEETTTAEECLTECLNGGYLCNCGPCISSTQVCDLITDCFDGEDEALPNCPSCLLVPFDNAEIIQTGDLHGQTTIYSCLNGFSLASGEVTFSFVCDSGILISTTPGPIPMCISSCGVTNFQCVTSGNCIPSANICDGLNHCTDGSDEAFAVCASICAPIAPPTNGEEVSPQARYLDGEAATFSCLPTFTLIGSATITCQSGAFQPDPPECFASCATLTGAFPDTQLISENVLHSGQVVFACNSGFSLATGQTSFSFTCNDGVWNYDTPGLSPLCTAITGQCATCGLNEECVNSACQCSTGYERVGTDCSDINECLTTSCPLPTEACFNTLGSFLCRAVTQIFYEYGTAANSFEVRNFFNLGIITDPCISPFVPIPSGLPIGSQIYEYLYYTCNGVVAYGDAVLQTTFPTPTDFNGNEAVAKSAVFWTVADFSSRGQMFQQTYVPNGNAGADDVVLANIGSQVRAFDQEASDNQYTPIWALIITWVGVPQPVDDAILFPNRVNTFQAIISMNGLQTYIIQLYQEGSLQWSVPDLLNPNLVIGFTDGMGTFQNAHTDPTIFPTTLQEFEIDRRIGNTDNLGQWIFRLDQNPYGGTGAKAECRARYFSDQANFDATVLLNAPLCPCTLTANDPAFINCRRPQADLFVEAIVGVQPLDNCLQQLTPTVTADAQYGSYCYYDTNNNLVPGFSTSVWTSSYVQRWLNTIIGDPTITQNWQEEDILFRYYCCGDADSTAASCSLYESRRPVLTCTGTLSLATADVTGDPHFITMDGARYTFNGLGEFVMIRSLSPLELQCRTGLAWNNLNETVATATVFVGFAVQFHSHRVQVVLNKERTGVEVTYNDAVLQIDDAFFTPDWQVTMLLDKNRKTGRKELIAAFQDSGNSTKLTFSVVSGTLSLNIVSNGIMAVNSVGLLGSQNGNLKDDFEFPDGSHLDIMEDEVIADSKVYPFGQAWRTTSDNSLFTYGETESWETFNDVNHKPIFFEDLMSDPSLASKIQQVRIDCSGVKECMFDALVTNNMDLASYSKEYVMEDILQRKLMANTPPSFVSITELHGDQSQPALRANTTLLVQLGNSYTYRVLFTDPDEGDNITLSLREDVPGAMIEDGDILHYTPQDDQPVQIMLVGSDGIVGTNQPLTVLLCNCFGGGCNFNTLLSGGNKFALVGCDCLDSYTGPNCDEDYDSCLDDPCYPGVTCIDHPPPEDIASCSECPTPLLGDGITCQDYDECADPSAHLCQQKCLNIEGSYQCTCNQGYELLPDGYNCQDIDECDRGIHSCGQGATCSNILGSYTCDCPIGFIPSSDRTLCQDINECLDGQVCFEGAWCYNTPGSYLCECPIGFVLVAGRCVDLNECLSEDLNNCGPNADCVNAPGSYRCLCKNGYHGIGTNCEDINECTISAYYCHPEFECVNKEQGYSCYCPEGYQGNGKECFDIDECSLGSQSCPQHSTCLNSAGSYSCVCDQGYKSDADGMCININECEEAPSICGGSPCFDTDGSFICECPPDSFRHQHGGCLSLLFNCDFSAFCTDADCTNTTCFCEDGYKPSSQFERCVDIDECLYQMDDCRSNEICTNTPGGFRCDCKPGYTKNGTFCQDVNECADLATFSCHQYAICLNTPGSYQCQCSELYEGNGITCVDKDECLQGPGCGENALCENTSPGFNCLCPSGFEKEGDSCRDIDECLIDPCITNATCHNTPGSFYCSCFPGFFGDGRNGHYGCHDIDECFEQVDICPEFSTCSNSHGTYSCQCYPGYQPDGSECIDMDECAAGFHDCDSNATCINLGGSYSCECNSGFFSFGLQSRAGVARGLGACTDIDECDLGVHGCHEYADCDNEIGSYRCTCRSGYHGDGHTCLDINECETSVPCAGEPNKICLNRQGTNQCVCQYGFTDDAGGSCQDADTFQLNIIFTDIKGLQTNVNYHLIKESDLDQLTEDIQNVLDDSSISSDILNSRINSMTKSTSGYALVTLRVDSDKTGALSADMILDAFNSGLSGRNKRLVPPDSMVFSATAEVPDIDPCRTGSHDCFDRMFRSCVYSGAGQYQCEECPQYFQLVNNVCVADPCQTGNNDCSARHFDVCVFVGSGDFLCETCSDGYVAEDADTCIIDPCNEGSRICSQQNFNSCVVDGSNRFHCEDCRLGFRLENGRCIGDTDNNPCFNGVSTCSLRSYQTCVYDAADNTYHCEDCLAGYKEEGEQCLADPCQLGLSNCHLRNYERCLYQPGGRFTCENCQVGFTEVNGECISTGQAEFKRFRGKVRVTAINSSTELATFQNSLQDLSSRLFRDYEQHFCDVYTHSLITQNPAIGQDFIQCFMLAFQEGSIISYFVIDVVARSSLQSLDLETAMLQAARDDGQHLYLYNRLATRSLTIDGSSISFIDTSRYGCNRNLICLNGGSCIEDPQVYNYVCRCPPEFTGDRCHLSGSVTTTTPSVLPEDRTNSPASLLVILAVIVVFMVVLLSACCCCFLVFNMQSKKRAWEQQQREAMQRMAHQRRYPNRRPIRDIGVVRNMLARKLAEEEMEMQDELEDYSEENIRHDEKRLSHLTDVLRHADFLNERMSRHGQNLPVYNHAYSDDETEGSSQRQEFEVPLVADGSEFASIQKGRVPDSVEMATIPESMEMDAMSRTSSDPPPYSDMERDLKTSAW